MFVPAKHSSLVYCLWVRTGAYLRSGAPERFFCSVVVVNVVVISVVLLNVILLSAIMLIVIRPSVVIPRVLSKPYQAKDA